MSKLKKHTISAQEQELIKSNYDPDVAFNILAFGCDDDELKRTCSELVRDNDLRDNELSEDELTERYLDIKFDYLNKLTEERRSTAHLRTIREPNEWGGICIS